MSSSQRVTRQRDELNVALGPEWASDKTRRHSLILIWFLPLEEVGSPQLAWPHEERGISLRHAINKVEDQAIHIVRN